MAERKLVPPAEQWHEVTILIPERQDHRGIRPAARRGGGIRGEAPVGGGERVPFRAEAPDRPLGDDEKALDERPSEDPHGPFPGDRGRQHDQGPVHGGQATGGDSRSGPQTRVDPE